MENKNNNNIKKKFFNWYYLSRSREGGAGQSGSGSSFGRMCGVEGTGKGIEKVWK